MRSLLVHPSSKTRRLEKETSQHLETDQKLFDAFTAPAEVLGRDQPGHQALSRYLRMS